MAAEDHLHPELFAKLKSRADATGKAQRAPGTDIYVPASKGSKDRRKQETRDWHTSLVPMKQTIASSGRNFARVMNHVQTNSEKLTGRRMGKDNARIWARDTHDSDPKNFMKNIGLR
jgi:hypothetical protein